MKTIALLVATILIIPSRSAPAQAPHLDAATRAKLQRIVDQAAAKTGTVGAQVSIVLGEERADFVTGSANVELKALIVETVIQIGSTKIWASSATTGKGMP